MFPLLLLIIGLVAIVTGVLCKVNGINPFGEQRLLLSLTLGPGVGMFLWGVIFSRFLLVHHPKAIDLRHKPYEPRGAGRYGSV